MPRPANVSWTTEAGGFPVIGSCAQQLRMARGMSIRQLANHAGINKNTVLRLERGEPVTQKVLNKVCVSLGTALASLTSRATGSARVRVFRGDESKWITVIQREDARGHLPNATSVPESSERERYGRLGFTCGFLMTHACTIANGKLMAGVYEIHHPWTEPFHSPGEEFVYCLQGEVRVTVGDVTYELVAGDSISFDTSQPFNFDRITLPPSPAPRVLAVWIEGLA